MCGLKKWFQRFSRKVEKCWQNDGVSGDGGGGGGGAAAAETDQKQ